MKVTVAVQADLTILLQIVGDEEKVLAHAIMEPGPAHSLASNINTCASIAETATAHGPEPIKLKLSS